MSSPRKKRTRASAGGGVTKSPGRSGGGFTPVNALDVASPLRPPKHKQRRRSSPPRSPAQRPSLPAYTSPHRHHHPSPHRHHHPSPLHKRSPVVIKQQQQQQQQQHEPDDLLARLSEQLHAKAPADDLPVASSRTLFHPSDDSSRMGTVHKTSSTGEVRELQAQLEAAERRRQEEQQQQQQEEKTEEEE